MTLYTAKSLIWEEAGGGTHLDSFIPNASVIAYLASSKRSPEIVRLLIEHGADINAQDRKLLTPLHFTSVSENPASEIVKVLIEHGADINALDERKRTPFHLAAYYSLALKGDIVRQFISHGANIDAKDERGRTPFQVAASSSFTEIAELQSRTT